MRFAIANTFQKALQKLEGKDSAAAKLAKRTAFDFQMNPTQSGFSFERLNKSKDPIFWSLRVNDGIRIIAHRAPSTADANICSLFSVVWRRLLTAIAHKYLILKDISCIWAKCGVSKWEHFSAS